MAMLPESSFLKAPACTSNRNPALRFFSSGPWQAKQLSEKIGRMSRLKSIARGAAARSELMAANITSPANSR